MPIYDGGPDICNSNAFSQCTFVACGFQVERTFAIRKGEKMKNVFKVLVSGLGLVLMIAVPTRAQLPGVPVRATIPFDFIVRGKTLPAGIYEINRIGESPETLQVYNKSDHQQMMFQTDPVEARTTPRRDELVFHKYGDNYFLYEIFTGGESNGRELPRSRTERRIEREALNRNTKPETVALVVN